MSIQQEVVAFLKANHGRILTKPEIAMGLAQCKVDNLLNSECADWIKDPVAEVDREYRTILRQLKAMKLRHLPNVRRREIIQ